MRIVAVLVLLVGVALAGGALLFASKYFAAYEASLAAQNKVPETVNLIVAKAPIKYGDVLNDGNLKWVAWPAESVPKGGFTSIEAMFGEPRQDRRAIRSIEEDEPILESKITGFGEDSRISMTLANGKRAVTIKIDAVTGVGGFISAGDHVDIVLTRSIDQQLVTSIILQNIPVIAVDQSARRDSNSPRVGSTATVEVNSVDAQKLALAQQIGKLSLLLRAMSEGDVEEPLRPVTTDDLVDLEREEKIDDRTKVRVRKGMKVKTLAFDEDTVEEQAEPAAAQ